MRWLKRQLKKLTLTATRLANLRPKPLLQPQSPRFKQLFPTKVTLQRAATGFQFTEGPVWIAEEHCLLFSDIPANQIFKLEAIDQVTVFRQPSWHANGLTRDLQGRLIACEHGSRRVTRTELDGSITVLAEYFAGKRLNSPNDVVVKQDGSIYFTDPTYGIQPQQQEQPLQGVYRLSPDGQSLTLVAADFDMPNGLAFSLDEQTLYVSDSARRHVRRFDVQPDGTLQNSRVLQDMNVQKPGLPDGMKLDRQGNLYCTGPGGVWVLDAAGQHLGTIVLPEQPANCAWGDDDGQSLYITAGTSIYKIRVKTPGLLLHRSSIVNPVPG